VVIPGQGVLKAGNVFSITKEKRLGLERKQSVRVSKNQRVYWPTKVIPRVYFKRQFPKNHSGRVFTITLLFGQKTRGGKEGHQGVIFRANSSGQDFGFNTRIGSNTGV